MKKQYSRTKTSRQETPYEHQAIADASEQPLSVDGNEIVIRLTVQDFKRAAKTRGVELVMTARLSHHVDWQ